MHSIKRDSYIFINGRFIYPLEEAGANKFKFEAKRKQILTEIFYLIHSIRCDNTNQT